MVGYKTKDTVPPCDNVSEQTQDKGNKSDEGNNKDRKSENNGDLKPAAKVTTSKELGERNNLNESGILPKRWRHTQAQFPNGSNNESEQNVQSLNYSLDITVPKFPLKVGWDFALHDILEVMLKDPDLEILYPIYQIGQAVVYVGDKSCI
eukprot:jgi/Psemu1/6393/gm1.6393_g